MNYFELFDLPISVHIDANTLSKNFYALSRKYHPDLGQAEDAHAQAERLDHITRVNLAYQTLKDDDKRLAYILSLKGLLADKKEMPAAFLMEMLDVNEQVSELSEQASEQEKQTLLQTLNHITEEIYAEVKTLIDNFNFDTLSESQAEALQVYRLKMKYVDRLRARVK